MASSPVPWAAHAIFRMVDDSPFSAMRFAFGWPGMVRSRMLKATMDPPPGFAQQDTTEKFKSHMSALTYGDAMLRAAEDYKKEMLAAQKSSGARYAVAPPCLPIRGSRHRSPACRLPPAQAGARPGGCCRPDG